jgi:hypothetical protein
MRLIALAAASLLSSLLHPAPSTVTTQVYGQGEWRLTVIKDSFTNQTSCKLENRKGVHPTVVAIPGGLAFRLDGRRLDTSNAWYKLDDQPARPWRDLRTALVAAGSLAAAEQLDGTSASWLPIPLDGFEYPKSIIIRSTALSPERRFSLANAQLIITSARNAGCQFPVSPDNRKLQNAWGEE